jgi:DNA ligase-1
MIQVRFHRGLELPAHGLWLDPWDPQPRAFVSHAHSDHIGAHAEIIASDGTARLLRERLAGRRLEHLLALGETREIFGLPVTLLAAGHIFGSAQFFTETDAGSLLYTGDFKLRAGLSAEPAQWRPAETLIMETTFGLPKYQFPPTAEVMARMVGFCQEALAEGDVPVLLGYSLGKAQEILCALVQAGLTPMLHGAVHKMTRVYQELRPDFPSFERYDAGTVAGKVLICPPSVARSRMLTQIKNRRVAMLTGWAMNPGATFRYGCDAAFPLSDHADYPDLLRYVELVQPQRVLTLHGFAAEFARDLRERGIEAWALGQENQLELGFRGFSPAIAEQAPVIESAPTGDSPFGKFAAVGEAISRTTSTLRKAELLATYLGEQTSDDLASAAIFLTGRAFPQADDRPLQTGWAIIKRALLGASGMAEARLREISRRHSDAGKTALEVLAGRTKPAPFSLAEARAFFAVLERARGPRAKTELLQKLLARLDAREGQYLVKILTGDLRIGLKEGLVEEAIARAFAAPLEAVREAHMLLGDLGRTAQLALEQRLGEAELQPFRPLKCMLASPEPTAEAIWKRAAEGGGGAIWLEDKFDGIRAQLHCQKGRVEIYSRDLKNVTAQFEEIAAAARGLANDVIFDGEIVAFEHGRALPFFALQKRLGRKSSADFFLGDDLPVSFVIFDLLWLDGGSLLKKPLQERRRELEIIRLPEKFERLALTFANSVDEIESAFTAARARGNEGLIAKDPQSLYSPGRRGLAWLKLKKEFATLDVVVVGAETGHGRRSHVLSDYTFSIRDEASGRLLTIGKAYSGLTDEEIEMLTAHFTAKTLRQRGRYREVEPDTVLEIAFDSIQPSERHESGLALRFPRIKAIRRDKSPAEIDTLDVARSLVARREF